MYGKVKLSKRQIKEDKFTAFILNAKNQFMENWQYFVIGIVIVILLVVAVVYYLDSQKVQHVEAGNRYANAMYDFNNGNTEQAILKLNQIIEDFSGDIFAEQSIYALGKINFENKNYPEAIRFFEMYVNRYKDDKLFRASSFAGIASCLENQANYSDAAVKFDEAYSEYPESPSAGDYLMGSLRNYLESGNIDNAAVKLEQISENFKGTQLEKRAIRLYSEKS